MLHTFTTIVTDFGLLQLALVWLVVIFAAVMRAFTGFGFALAAVPVFTLLMSPVESVVLSIMLTLAVSLFTLKTFWGQFPLGPMLPMVSFALLGTLIGTLVLAMLDAASFQLWIGLAVIAACALLTFYRPTLVEPRADVGRAVGLVSGLMNGVFGVPGPPVVVYAVATQPSAAKARALLMTFFLFTASFGFVSHAAAGHVGMHSLWLFALSFPAMYLGDKVGYWLFKRYGTHLHRQVALVVLFAVGFAITARALLVA
ncbi:MAG: putative membrane protein YfcA [Halioglobus sp.]|jgi:uncharacterized membrane protein YfcA